jgi:adenosylcobinamide kinase/adenosylcobinamide-phosphate guanylyltransferase
VGDVWFVTGGARSGKSRFAEQLAAGSGRDVVYVATMEPSDDELAQRIARHRAERPAAWRTVEAPRALLAAVTAQPPETCVLVDCLSLWVSNRLLTLGDPPPSAALDALEARIDEELGALLAHEGQRGGPLVLVSNEVGGGVVPEHALGRAYRDVLGRANQRAAAGAARAWLLVAGLALELPAREATPDQR